MPLGTQWSMITRASCSFDRVEPTIEQWHHWRAVLRIRSVNGTGFAFFFLNCTCRSGAINGGVTAVWRSAGDTVGRQIQQGTTAGQIGVPRAGRRTHRSAWRRRASKWCTIMRDGPAHSCMRIRCMWSRVEPGTSTRSMRSVTAPLSEVLVRGCGGTWMLTYDDAPLVSERMAACRVAFSR